MVNYQEYILPNILDSGIIQKAINFFTTREMINLPLKESFNDSGVYALYYSGTFEQYHPITCLNEEMKSSRDHYPIYIGKAVPKGSRTARTTTSIEQSLYKRLEEHTKSIQSAENLKIEDFTCRITIMRDNEVDLIVPLESALIRQYSPLWNSCVSGFGIHHPGSGRYGQKKSEWDTLHPGRYFADRLTGKELDIDRIIHNISIHLKEL